MADWTSTVLQSLPRLRQVVRAMRPTYRATSIAEISPDFLREQGIELVIWDVDGTLGPWHMTALTPPWSDSLAALTRTPGVSHLVLSNCSDRRWPELGRLFPELPVLKGYSTDQGLVGRRQLGGTETWLRAGQAVDPAPDSRALRKPSAELVQLALDVAGGTPPGRALMIGDQYLTDIAGANMAGVRSLKVPTHARGSFPNAVRMLQRGEDLLFAVLHGRKDDATWLTPRNEA